VSQRQLAHASSRGIFRRVVPFRKRKPHPPFYVAEISAGRGQTVAAKTLRLSDIAATYSRRKVALLLSDTSRRDANVDRLNEQGMDKSFFADKSELRGTLDARPSVF
jgi:hypothetical protein